MGCLTRVGCISLVAAAGVAGYWLYGDRLPSVLSRAASGTADQITRVAVEASERFDSADGPKLISDRVETIRAERLERDRRLGWVDMPLGKNGSRSREPAASGSALSTLGTHGGPAYVTISAKDLGEIVGPLLSQLPPSATSAQLALSDGKLMLRTTVRSAEVVSGAGTSGIKSLLGGVMGESDTLFLSGTLDPVEPGLVQFRIRELRVRSIEVPNRLIPIVVRKLRTFAGNSPGRVGERNGSAAGSNQGTRSATSEGLADDGLPIRLPAVASDARVVGDRLTIYSAAPSGVPANAKRKP